MQISLALSITNPLLTGGGAAMWADGPAPSGFRWDFVFDDLTGLMLRDDVSGEPVVALARN